MTDRVRRTERFAANYAAQEHRERKAASRKHTATELAWGIVAETCWGILLAIIAFMPK